MDSASGRNLVLVLGLTVAAASAGQDKVATPTEQYKAILKDCQFPSEVLSKAPNDEERKKIAAHLDRMPQRFFELAEKNPQDPIAVDVLIQVVWMGNNNNRGSAKDGPAGRAMAILLRDHVRNSKLSPVCLRLTAGFRKEYETFLRTVLELNPNEDVQGLACLALAKFLKNRLERLDLLKDQPAAVKEYEDLFGKDYLEALRRQDRAKVATEVEALYERAAKKYGNVRIPADGDWLLHPGAARLLEERPPRFGNTVAEKVKAELFDVSHLAVGKEAPDIEGEDQNGKPFKLSDYRGKVVLLDFWLQF